MTPHPSDYGLTLGTGGSLPPDIDAIVDRVWELTHGTGPAPATGRTT